MEVMRPQAEFVDAVMQKLGLSKTELGVALKKPNAYAAVHGWTVGRKNLSYEDTMAMLELCGWLNMDGDARAAAGQFPDPLERIAVGVTELLRDQKKILRRLPVEQREPQRSQGRVPAKSSARKKTAS